MAPIGHPPHNTAILKSISILTHPCLPPADGVITLIPPPHTLPTPDGVEAGQEVPLLSIPRVLPLPPALTPSALAAKEGLHICHVLFRATTYFRSANPVLTVCDEARVDQHLVLGDRKRSCRERVSSPV